MKNHEAYMSLSLREKWELIGKAVHLLQNSRDFYFKITREISLAEQRGEMDDVKIFPITRLPDEELERTSY